MDLDVPPEEDAGAGVPRIEGDRERVRARPRLREVLDDHNEVRERAVDEARPLDPRLRPLEAHGGDERGGERQSRPGVDVVDLPLKVRVHIEIEAALASGRIRCDRSAPRDLPGYWCGAAADDEVERPRRVDVLEERIPRDLTETERAYAEQHRPCRGEPDVREGHVDYDRPRRLVEAPARGRLRRIQDDLTILRGRRDTSVPGRGAIRGGPRPGEERRRPARDGLRARVEDAEARLTLVPDGGGLPPREPDDGGRSCRRREARRVRNRHRDPQEARVC